MENVENQKSVHRPKFEIDLLRKMFLFWQWQTEICQLINSISRETTIWDLQLHIKKESANYVSK